MMIVTEKNGKRKVYTFGGDRVGFWIDVHKVIVGDEEVYQVYVGGDKAEKLLSDMVKIIGQKDLA